MEWDIKHGPEFDLLDPAARRRLLSFIAEAKCVHLGTPCTSFSGARRGHPGAPGGPIRTKQFPMGIPNPQPQDVKKIQDGNSMLRLTIVIIKMCRRLKIPVMMENPRRSRIWWTPSLRPLVERSVPVHVDYCQFNMSWQKPTTFAVW